MNWKKIVVSTVLNGIVLLLVLVAVQQLAIAINPNFNPSSLKGMRSPNDPILVFYFAYPWVLALALSIAFSFFHRSFGHLPIFKQGVHFGLIVWMLICLPNAFLLYTSMDYGETFFLANTLSYFISFIIAGIVASFVFAKK